MFQDEEKNIKSKFHNSYPKKPVNVRPSPYFILLYFFLFVVVSRTSFAHDTKWYDMVLIWVHYKDDNNNTKGMGKPHFLM